MENVLITGGTSGIGYALARVFAKNNYNLILVSSNYENLKNAQQKLESEFSITVHIFEQDLSELNGAENLYTRIQENNIPVDILINNAGYGLVGATEKINHCADKKMMVLNMITIVSLCKLFLPHMYEKKHGIILNISSTGAFQPGPFTSTYFASKAFVLSYSKAIRFEDAKYGVQVCTLCPGATKTNFFAREGTDLPKASMSADKVAKEAYRQIIKNKSVFVPGFSNRFMQAFPMNIKMLAVAKMKKD